MLDLNLKIFLKFYEGDFGQVSMKTLEAELDLWEEHWSQSELRSLIVLVQH